MIAASASNRRAMSIASSGTHGMSTRTPGLLPGHLANTQISEPKGTRARG
ncbi:Uncharacterised protein [Mycobacteroides abscessus subsp. abscessus]|nr:Uncharacterised protein [Mycobacteroides abscessus subsp. abscessus]